MSVKDFDGLWVSFHTPVIDRIVCHKCYSIERDPLPKRNIIGHGVGLHLALHFNVENLKGFCRWNSGTEVTWIKQQRSFLSSSWMVWFKLVNIQTSSVMLLKRCVLNRKCKVATNIWTTWQSRYNAKGTAIGQTLQTFTKHQAEFESAFSLKMFSQVLNLASLSIFLKRLYSALQKMQCRLLNVKKL